MRKLLATALLLAGTSGVAFAADLPSRTAPVYAPPLPPVFTWSGGYFGINAGYAFDYSSRFQTFNDPAAGALSNATGVPLLRPAVANTSSDGFTGGGQIGYNYQFGAGSGIVVGIEADAAYTDLGSTRSITLGSGPSLLHSDMDFLGTVRGRVGYGFDRVLVYGTGGFAFGDVTQHSRFYSSLFPGALLYNGGRSEIDTGYAYGGGVEFAIPTDNFLNFFHSSAVTVKAEYLHYDLGTASYGVSAVAGNPQGSTGTYIQRVRTDGDLARVGVNYKF